MTEEAALHLTDGLAGHEMGLFLLVLVPQVVDILELISEGTALEDTEFVGADFQT